jgi:hypothetical protein
MISKEGCFIAHEVVVQGIQQSILFFLLQEIRLENRYCITQFQKGTHVGFPDSVDAEDSRVIRFVLNRMHLKPLDTKFI